MIVKTKEFPLLIDGDTNSDSDLRMDNNPIESDNFTPLYI